MKEFITYLSLSHAHTNMHAHARMCTHKHINTPTQTLTEMVETLIESQYKYKKKLSSGK